VGVAAFTVTWAVADFAESASLVEVTVSLPLLAGAVYSPDDVICPRAAFQLTDLLLAVPWTVAENCTVAPVVADAEAGVIVTEVTFAALVPLGGTLIGVLDLEAEADPAHPATNPHTNRAAHSRSAARTPSLRSFTSFTSLTSFASFASFASFLTSSSSHTRIM
jgi:hypothetical protein